MTAPELKKSLERVIVLAQEFVGEGGRQVKTSSVTEAYEIVGSYMQNQTPEGWRQLLEALRPYMPPVKVAIQVEGGCVQEVRSTSPDTQVVLIDLDDGDVDEEARADNDAKYRNTKKWAVVL